MSRFVLLVMLVRLWAARTTTRPSARKFPTWIFAWEPKPVFQARSKPVPAAEARKGCKPAMRRVRVSLPAIAERRKRPTPPSPFRCRFPTHRRKEIASPRPTPIATETIFTGLIHAWRKGTSSKSVTLDSVATGKQSCCEGKEPLCYQGDVYWFDACGTLGDVKETCPDGTTCKMGEAEGDLPLLCRGAGMSVCSL